MAASSSAASRTLEAIGPAVSWVWLMGTMPSAGINPTVGFNPTTPFTDEGQTIEPLVSVPTANGASCIAMATADPELEPQAERCELLGFTVRPPTALQPLEDQRERMFAHSERLDFAMTM